MTRSAPQNGPLAGKTALVTGSSRGIGRAIAREFAAAAARVIVHGRADSDHAHQTVQQLKQLGTEAAFLAADLSDPKARAALVEQAWSWKNGIDIWVNNAGADVLTGDDAALDFESKLRRLWQIDVEATIALSRAAGARMRAASREAGSHMILNMGWDQAEQGMAGDSGEMFAAVKGAIMAFSRSLAQSLAPQVRVNCLAPGWIQTAWGQSASARWQQRAAAESLLRRWGTPEDVARAARFLASPDAAFISGQIIQVNGGFRFGQDRLSDS